MAAGRPPALLDELPARPRVDLVECRPGWRPPQCRSGISLHRPGPARLRLQNRRASTQLHRDRIAGGDGDSRYRGLGSCDRRMKWAIAATSPSLYRPPGGLAPAEAPRRRRTRARRTGIPAPGPTAGIGAMPPCDGNDELHLTGLDARPCSAMDESPATGRGPGISGACRTPLAASRASLRWTHAEAPRLRRSSRWPTARRFEVVRAIHRTIEAGQRPPLVEHSPSVPRARRGRRERGGL